MAGSSTVPFVGRAHDLEHLQALLKDVVRGVGRVAIVEGEAGIGKSRLVDATVEAAGHLGLHVFSGSAQELERDRPFGLVVDTFGLRSGADDPIQREIAGLIEGGSGVGRHSDDRFRIVERVVDLVEVSALRLPRLIVLEDLHWADPSTLVTLSRLASSVQHLPVALMCTARPAPRRPELIGLLDGLDSAGALRISLAPLNDDEVAELVAATLGVPAGPQLATKVGGAGGNPLFVSELLMALEQEHLIDRAAGAAEVADIATPPSLTLTILRRLAFLPEECLETLRVASVLGAAFSMKDLSVVIGKSALALLPAIEEAKTAGLLGESGEHLVFRHDLVRDAIYQDMLQPIRKALHAQAARALAEVGAPTAQIAAHAALGAEVGDMEAADWLQRAASEAAARAPLVAVELLERALDLVGTDTVRRASLGLSLLWTYLVAQRATDAERVARNLLVATVDLSVRSAAQRGLVHALWLQGRSSEALEVVEARLEDPSLTAPDRARLIAEKANILREFDRTTGGLEAERALELGEEAGDQIAMSIAVEALAFCLARDGHIEEALRLTERSKRMAVASQTSEIPGYDDHELVALRRANFAELYLVWLDRFDEADRALQQMASELQEITSSEYHFARAHLDLWAGRWDESIAVAETGLTLSKETGRPSHNFSQILCYIAIQRDDIVLADQYFRDLPGAMWTRALIAEAKGDRAELEQTLAEYVRQVDNPLPWMMPVALWWAPDWVRLYLDAGNRRCALVMTEVLEEAARRIGSPTAQGAALRCRGLCDDDPEMLLRSVGVYRTGPRPFDTAQACEWAALVVAPKERSTERAVALLDEALEAYESVGALRAIARAEAHLRNLGVRRGRRGPRGRPKTGWESLTESELRVAGLVEEGLSYREIGERLFISKRTVETHVAHVFGKLGFGSRRELAEAVRERSA